MVYVGRDEEGKVVALSEVPQSDEAETLPADHPEILDFLARTLGEDSADRFQQADMDFVRVAEDLIEALIRKGVISAADLPVAARAKLSERRSLRAALAGSGLFIDEDAGS